ncbi:NAD(P)/FAD-dependent oxidoreductase [Roseiconus lacunae]|uniref:NAD(P)/FAD-dependent oxidoreductase n=1 Tax=Roseiconus lacunae TaxID=2605694 RepID=A0ABT7PBZ3_9BACT|nr:NAD(P)/FAD-dependent oxidoreductase [Roseiconus lacunae]MCD0463535.1 NAD(P)/FAD-dependent oxidoreductase [Roseiconus lacunae]MDM4014015.1 NAD(P)/FAD-dependent oxidoreductase [Roseiconus lacunae]
MVDEANSSPPKRRWLVIGAGVMGLKVADELIAKGQDVTIAEAAPTVGGLTSAWKLGDVTWDRFYHVTLLSDSVLREKLRDLDLEDEIRWVETKTGFYAGGELLSMSNTLEFLRFKPLSLFQRLRLGGTIFLASKIRDFRSMERQSVEAWLRRWSGRGAFEKVWLPLLKAKLGDAYQKTSAAFIWAHTQRMYKARRSGAKKEMFGYVPGGYARILETWTEQLASKGMRLLLGHSVREIRKLDNDTDGSRQIEVDFHDASSQIYDCVISTIASPLIARQCVDLTEQEKQQHRSITYLGVVCASLLLKKPISEYYVTNITDTWVPLTGIIEMSTIVDPERELGGHHLVYLPKYMTDDHPDLAEPDDDYRERCLQTLEKMYDHFSRDDVLEFKVARAKYVAALSTVDYSTRLPPVVTSVPGLYALNSAHILEGNLNVNETLHLGATKFHGEVWPDFVATKH